MNRLVLRRFGCCRGAAGAFNVRVMLLFRRWLTTLGLASCMAGGAFAQEWNDYGAASSVDRYGNAQFWFPSRRNVGVFQNPVQSRALRGYQDIGRRPDQRRDFFAQSDFFLGGLYRRRGTDQPVYLSFADPFRVTPEVAFNRYGGFGDRRTPGGDDMARVFERRFGLVQATANAAPVRRALMRYSNSAAFPDELRSTPFVATADSMDGPAAVESNLPAGPSLEERLHESTERIHERTRLRAWTAFREGDYPRALRGFEGALTLAPDDRESAIGEVFCHIALGRMRSAIAWLGEQTRRQADLFTLDTRIASRFASPADAHQVRLQCQLFAQGSGDSLAPNALYALILWHLGERSEAVLVAEAIARNHPGTLLARWPQAMAAARAAEESAGP